MNARDSGGLQGLQDLSLFPTAMCFLDQAWVVVLCRSRLQPWVWRRWRWCRPCTGPGATPKCGWMGRPGRCSGGTCLTSPSSGGGDFLLSAFQECVCCGRGRTSRHAVEGRKCDLKSDSKHRTKIRKTNNLLGFSSVSNRMKDIWAAWFSLGLVGVLHIHTLIKGL